MDQNQNEDFTRVPLTLLAPSQTQVESNKEFKNYQVLTMNTSTPFPSKDMLIQLNDMLI